MQNKGTTIRRMFWTCVTVGFAFTTSTGKANATVQLDRNRLAEIEAALPEFPRADGAPASDRAKWEPLAATKEGQAAIRNAEKINGDPVQDTPDNLYLEFSQNGNR